MKLTSKQRAVLDFIVECQGRTGLVPTTREIQARFGFASQTAAVNHLRALERKGVIQRQPGKARALSIVSQMDRERIVDIPIYGAIAAGFAQDAEEEMLGKVSIDATSIGSKRGARTFALRVRGDSMEGAHIADGDVVILETRPPREGDVVAALIDGETTLKRLVREDGSVFLRAENPRFPDLHPVGELTIQGVMVGLVRRVK